MQKVVILLLFVGIVFVYGQQTASSSNLATATYSPNPNNVSSSSGNGTGNGTDGFICRQLNNYDFRTWVPMGNFLSLDAGAPANWTMTQSTARVTFKPNGRPTALLSPDVWTGRVQWTGYMRAVGNGQARKLGFLFGMVSPKTKFLLLEWSNDANVQTGCVQPVVTTSWQRTLPGIVLRSIENPLGNSAVQQICNFDSSVDQTNVTHIIYAQDTNDVARREADTDYWFNITMDTFNNSVVYSIQKSNSTGRIIANGTIAFQNHALSNNFSLGRIGALVAGGEAIFTNWTVTPETCLDNYWANCGYFCQPQFNTSMTYSESPQGRDYEDEGSNEGLHWYAILLIILSILICCCCICVIIAAIVVFFVRRNNN